MTARSRKQVDSLHRGAETVSRIEKTGPTHARGLSHLAGLGINVRQGEPCEGMRVDFELSCGSAHIRIGGDDFNILLRTCYVRLQLENCEVLPHSRYQYRLGKGSFEISGTEAQSTGQERELGFALEGGVDANATAPSVLARLKGRFKRGTSKSQKNEEVVRSHSLTDLVVTSGQDRWQVGDPVRGDARRRDGRLLGTYFGEERDKDGEPKPLCIVGRLDPETVVVLTVSASASFGHVIIERIDRCSSDIDNGDAEAFLKPLSAKAIKEHSAVKARLRSRVAGLVMAKALGEAQRQAGLQVSEGEFMIALQSLGIPVAQPQTKTGCGENL